MRIIDLIQSQYYNCNEAREEQHHQGHKITCLSEQINQHEFAPLHSHTTVKNRNNNKPNTTFGLTLTQFS